MTNEKVNIKNNRVPSITEVGEVLSRLSVNSNPIFTTIKNLDHKENLDNSDVSHAKSSATNPEATQTWDKKRYQSLNSPPPKVPSKGYDTNLEKALAFSLDFSKSLNKPEKEQRVLNVSAAEDYLFKLSNSSNFKVGCGKLKYTEAFYQTRRWKLIREEWLKESFTLKASTLSTISKNEVLSNNNFLEIESQSKTHKRNGSKSTFGKTQIKEKLSEFTDKFKKSYHNNFPGMLKHNEKTRHSKNNSTSNFNSDNNSNSNYKKLSPSDFEKIEQWRDWYNQLPQVAIYQFYKKITETDSHLRKKVPLSIVMSTLMVGWKIEGLCDPPPPIPLPKN